MRFQPSKYKTVRMIYLSFGFLFFFIGLIGLFLPIIPGFLFLIPAVICFAKASTWFHNKVSRSKRFGKYFHSSSNKNNDIEN